MATKAVPITIFDTTLRDGEQSAGAGLLVGEKVRIAHQLARLGVGVIEAGFAVSSAGDFESIQRISREVKGPVICALARAVEADIKVAADALKGAERPRIHTFLSSSDIHLKYQMRRGREDIADMVTDKVKLARKYVEDVEFSPMDASRTDIDYLCHITETAIAAGATTVNIPDTVGYAIPEEFGVMIKTLFDRVPNIDQAVISVHCHNDLGMAAANSIVAIQNGARQIEGCINGLGERAGNAALEEVIMAVETRRDLLGFTTNINTEEIGPASRLIADIFGFPVQYNKAIVGKNAFRHSSGIHQDGYIKDKSTFEIMEPDQVGWRGEVIVLSKLSGRAGLKKRLDKLGYNLSDEEILQVFGAFKKIADTKSEITEDDLHSLMSIQNRKLDLEASYRLVSLALTHEKNKETRAEVELTKRGEVITGAGVHSGTINAVFSAIAKLTKTNFRLSGYNVTAATEGRDAIAEATVRLTKDEVTYSGRGTDIDVVTASAKAYVNAINRSLVIAEQNVLDSED